MKSQRFISLIVLGAFLLAPLKGHSYYNPTTGRWLTRDPIAEKGGANLFASVANDPLRRYDVLGQNPSEPEDPPKGNIDPPPKGPFTKCRIALSCHTAHGPSGCPVLFKHCGLIVDTGAGVYAIDGSGGSINSRWLTPSNTGNATEPWQDNEGSVCECLFKSITDWNSRKIPRDNVDANSNWNLKCAVKKCSVALNWGSWGKARPLGYHARECVRSLTPFVVAGTACSVSCCIESREIPCPDS